MMATTHALVGAAVGAFAGLLAPESAPLLVVGGFLGGLAPDLDLYVGHRRTLHYPVYAPAVAVLLGGAWLLVPSPWALLAAVVAAAAALHAVMDAFGAGLELRPWEGRSERAVYDHFRGVWIRPRRWVRYDGAPEDLAIAAAVGAPLALGGGDVGALVTATLAVSGAYAVLRKPMAALTGWLAARAPPGVRPYLPERFHG